MGCQMFSKLTTEPSGHFKLETWEMLWVIDISRQMDVNIDLTPLLRLCGGVVNIAIGRRIANAIYAYINAHPVGAHLGQIAEDRMTNPDVSLLKRFAEYNNTMSPYRAYQSAT